MNLVYCPKCEAANQENAESCGECGHRLQAMPEPVASPVAESVSARPDEAEARDEVPLTGILAEFRTALQEEIAAARRQAAGNAVPLANGRRIAQVGSAYQYIFAIENVLNLPGDAPGDLYVPERAPLEVTVISVDGMAITLSVPVDLGAFVATARLQSNLAHLMRKLIERIEDLADTPNPVGDRVLGARLVAGEAVPMEAIETMPNSLPPNPEQLSAIASSLGRNTTFIWGPPGTGKSRTIGSIGEQLYRRGRSVLLVSHTNNAVDQALWYIGDSVDPAELEHGKVLRVGEPKDPRLRGQPELLASTHVARRSEELTGRRTEIETELNVATIEVIQLGRKIDVCEWVGEARTDLTEMGNDVISLAALERERDNADEKVRELENRSDYWAAAWIDACEAQRQLRKSQEFDTEIARIRGRLAAAYAKHHQAIERNEEAEALLAETTSVGWLVRRWRRLPSPDEQHEVVEKARSALKLCLTELEYGKKYLLESEKSQRDLLNKVQAFFQTYSEPPETVVRQAEDHTTRLARLQVRVKDLIRRCLLKRRELNALLAARLSAVREWGFTSETTGSPETMLEAIREAYKRAVEEVAAYDPAELRTKRRRLNGRIQELEAELAEIDEALKNVEELVIADATIVATTLTRAYLREAIQSRRFDTVILDEASMAPIPALWIAASLADANAIVVGDFKQLPPIVQSEHKLAQKWLGRDIFDEAGLTPLPDPPPPFFIALKRQYRMHPSVSAIPNALTYNNLLEDQPVTSDDGRLDDWYNRDWGHDHPVLLVDTGPVGAWVTSVARGARSSRLNFLSATICVDIAHQLLRDDRPAMQPGDNPHIFVVCPYRPHAQLLELLLREECLTDDVRAGTAHTFQGSEADVVILDLVNDEPHWRVMMFDPKRDKNTKRLLNVALTRARRRLIVVGDFDYIAKQSKKAFIGTKLMPFLKEKYPCVSALDIVRCGLAARAAKAQSAVLGGDVEPDADRIVVTQEHFYSILRGDISRSKSRIVIYSPFITAERLGQLQGPVRAAVERGVQTYVVTKTHDERSKRDLPQYCMLEKSLSDWGIVVIHKHGMHEKLIFLDDIVLWSGSLNPLSFRDTQEVMERRFSKTVVADYVRTLRLVDLVGEYDGGPPSCPICGGELVASEGRDQPFFWRCVVEGCDYTRGIDEPRLDGGMIPCSACGAAVEFGEWGGKPAWRCKDNRHHHRKVARTHIRLPKMRAIIPKRFLRNLDRQFGIPSESRRKRPPDSQGQLFPME